jgi:predicted  nucleic acid-binding Zn-ribbon protein
MSLTNRFRVIIHEQGNERYEFIEKDSFVIGRSVKAEIVINDDRLSRQHVQITLVNEAIWIEDLGSSNGSFIDGKKLPPRQKVAYHTGQRLELANTPGLHFNIEYQAAQHKTRTGIKLQEIMQAQEASQARIIEIPKEAQREKTRTNIQIQIPVQKVANGSEVANHSPKVQPTPRAAPIVEAPAPKVRKPLQIKDKLALLDAIGVMPENLEKIEQTGKEKLTDLKSKAESNLFEQIKNLVGSEAEEIRLAAIEEAKGIRRKAEDYALEVIQGAKQNAEMEMEETEKVISQKLDELRQTESAASDKLEIIKNTYQEIENEIDGLKESEVFYRQKLVTLQDTIKTEEARIKNETQKLESIRSEIVDAKKQFEVQEEELQLEERRIKAKLETELAEARLKTTQIFAEAERAQTQKNLLDPEIHFLKGEKVKLETELNEFQLQRRRLEDDLERVNKEHEFAKEELAQARKNHERVVQEIDSQRQGFLMFQKELDARDEELRQKFSKSHLLADEIIAKAQSEAQRVIDDAKLRSESITDDAHEELKRLSLQREKLKIEIERERISQADALKADADKLRIELQSEVDELKKKRNNLVNDIDEIKRTKLVDIEKMEKKAIDDYNRVLKDGKEEALILKNLAEKDAVKLKEQAKQYYDDSKKKTDDMLNQLVEEIQEKKKEALKIHQDRMQDYKRQLAQIEEKKKQVEAELSNIEKTREDRLAEATKAAQSMIEQSKLQAKELLSKIELDVQDQKKKQQALLAELKHKEMLEIKEMRSKEEEDILKKKADRAKAVATNIYALINTEMFKARNKLLSEEFINAFTKDIKEIVVDTMLDKSPTDSNKLQKILKSSINSKEKEEKYWKEMGMKAGFAVGGLVILLILWNVASPLVINAFKDNGQPTQSDKFLEQVKEARQKAVYTPETTPEFKASYVDNILYTTDFLTKKQDQAFHDKWVLELNDYFIYRLDVKDTSIIKFVSLEANLIKELTKLRENIDPQNPESKIQEMRVKEDEFKQKLGTIFADPIKVGKFYDFSTTFWNNFYNPRRPANSPKTN